MKLKTISLPRMFFEDHEDRELPTPAVVKRNKKTVVVSVDDPNLEELRSDADYYSDARGFDPCYRRLCASARRTVAAIERAGAGR